MDEGKVRANSGLYQLFISIKEDIEIQVGKLGKFSFTRGLYIYTGSAAKNLQQRVTRHQSKSKKLHWHIDYLLNSPHTEIIDIIIYENNDFTECELNIFSLNKYKGSSFIKGFGSSDCNNCFSHLIKYK